LNQNWALIFCFDAFSSREPVSTSLENALGARFQNQKRELSAKCCDFREPIGGVAVAMLMPLQYSVRELPALQFFGGIGPNNRAEELQDP
jgi:hypothetical protein